jgi:hypothetical protein
MALLKPPTLLARYPYILFNANVHIEVYQRSVTYTLVYVCGLNFAKTSSLSGVGAAQKIAIVLNSVLIPLESS